MEKTGVLLTSPNLVTQLLSTWKSSASHQLREIFAVGMEDEEFLGFAPSNPVRPTGSPEKLEYMDLNQWRMKEKT